MRDYKDGFYPYSPNQGWIILSITTPLTLYNVFYSRNQSIQEFPQGIRRQRRLCGIYTVYLIIHMIPCNHKLVFSFAKSLNKPFQDHIQGWRHILNLESSYFRGFKSSLQFHPLWVTLSDYYFVIAGIY